MDHSCGLEQEKDETQFSMDNKKGKKKKERKKERKREKGEKGERKITLGEEESSLGSPRRFVCLAIRSDFHGESRKYAWIR
jgi:hypothetical protein